MTVIHVNFDKRHLQNQRPRREDVKCVCMVLAIGCLALACWLVKAGW